MYDPKLEIGQILSNSDIVSTFKCGTMGGMRRSKVTNTLVLISDYTKGIYHDKWIGGVLHYTGMGKNGDQDINWAQNATLATYGQNDVDFHLFEVMDAGDYIYCGRIELVDKPYEDIQPGEDGIDRKVWIFPVRPVPDNNVKKPDMFVFKDMNDYRSRGKNVDEEYMKMLASQKRAVKNKTNMSTVQVATISSAPTKPAFVVPNKIIGQRIRHKSFGEGTIAEIEGTSIIVSFSSVGSKKLGYEMCIKNKLIAFI